MKKHFKKLVAFGSLGALLLVPVIALGADPVANFNPGVQPIVGGEDLSVAGVIKSIVVFILAFAAAIAVLFLVIGGILYMTSAGNEDRVKKARSMIFAAIIGLLVIILSFVIVNFTTSTVNTLNNTADQQSAQ